MKAMVAVSSNWGIGYQNQLLFRLKGDMKHFKDLTTGHSVLMGRKTFTSIGKPLPNRTNYVLTKQQIHIPNVHVIHHIQDIQQMPDMICIGGMSVYQQCLPFCHTVKVTKIFQEKLADTFFPNLDELPNWSITHQSEIFQENGISYQFITYTNLTTAYIK